jgi:hypothetical protein
MKFTPPAIAGLSAAVLLLIGLVYVNSQLGGAQRELKQAKDENAALEGRVGSLQLAVDALNKKAKDSEATQATLQALAKNIQGGDMELSLKSLKIVAGGKSLVLIGATPDQGGMIDVASSDGSSNAEVASGPGASRLAFKSVTASGQAQVVHLASFQSDGYYIQKGPTDDEGSRTDGAGLKVADAGSTFFMAQNGAGNISVKTSSGEEKAKVSIWAEGDQKKLITLNLGADGPQVTVAGGQTGGSLALLPDHLSLLGKDNAASLALGTDANGGSVLVNDAAGNKRAFLAVGSDGRGSLSVYGNRKSNTFLPVFDLQQTDSQR